MYFYENPVELNENKLPSFSFVIKFNTYFLYYRSVNFKRTFWYSQFSQKTNKTIRLNYYILWYLTTYDTLGGLVFVRFLGEFEDIKKTFQN